MAKVVTKGAKNSKVTDYWLKFYLKDGHCCLCGNWGVIDTTGVRTPVGISVGKKSWCICPNGQAIRSQVDGDPEQ